jgi:hypothetical protein
MRCSEYTDLGLEAPPGFEPGMEVLQTSALPLGDGADQKGNWGPGEHRIVPDAYRAINIAAAVVDC